MNIVGITGRAGAGKDTIADYLVEEYGYVKVSFATPLKEKVKERFNLKDGDFDPDVKEEGFECFGFKAIEDHEDDDMFGPLFSARDWLQWLGTEFARELFGQDCWANLLERRLKEYPPGTKFVISDVRFENEAAWLGAIGGTLLKVTRDGKTAQDHVSEKGVSWCYVYHEIENKGSIEELYRQVRVALDLEPPEPEVAPFVWQDYIEFVNSTWLDGQLDECAHAGFGLVEEAGEVAGCFKRGYRGDGAVDVDKLKKELGDTIYYWTKVCELHGLDPVDVINDNVEKITDRKARGVLRGSGGDR
jgi:NTP pyrophosphatase (non-canonical NTP hydrolase)